MRLLGEVNNFVSDRHNRVAQLIKEYSHELDLVYVPPEQRALNEEFPFAILHTPGDRKKEPYIVRKVREEDMDERLIQWLYMSDRIGDVNACLEAGERAKAAWTKKIQDEFKAEQYDFVKSVIRGKNYYRHNGRKYS